MDVSGRHHRCTSSEMPLYLIGLGLGDAKDITVRGLEIVRKAQHVYLEAYTSILTVGKEALVSFTLDAIQLFLRF